jgi:hypothetical protein
MPGPLRNTVVVLAAVTAGLLLVGGTALITIPKIHAFSLALDAMALRGGRAAVASGAIRTGMHRMIPALGAATGALLAFQAAGAAASAVFGESFTPKMDALTEGVARFGREGKVSGEAARSLGGDFDKLSQAIRTLGPEGVGPNIGNAIKSATEWTFQLDQVQGSLGRSREQVTAFDDALASLVQGGRQDEAAAAFERLATLANEQGVSTERLKDLLPGYAAALETASGANSEAAGSIAEVGDAAADAAGEVEALREEFDLLFGLTMGLDRAQIAYKRGMQELVEAIEDGARTLDINSTAGRDNRDAVLDQVDAVADLRQAHIDNGMSIEDANRIYDDQLVQIENALIKRGFEEESVRDLIDSYRGIPEDAVTNAEFRGMTKAQRDITKYIRQIEGIPPGKTVTITTRHVNQFITQTFGVNAPQLRQHGGEIHGPAGPDRVPVMATAGEIMIRQPVAQANRAALLALNATGRWPARPAASEVAVTLRYEFETRGTELDRLIQQSVERGMRTSSSFRTAVRGPGP